MFTSILEKLKVDWSSEKMDPCLCNKNGKDKHRCESGHCKFPTKPHDNYPPEGKK